MSINLMLPSTMTVRRSVADYSDGSPSYTWQTVAENVPCLVSRRDWAETYADASPTKARAVGTLYTEPDADVQSGDSCIVAGLGTFTVGVDGGLMTDYLQNPHHKEFAVSQVK